MVPSWHNLAEPHSFIAMSFGAGLVPFSPGTAGALVAVPMAWVILKLPVALQAGAVVIFFLVGIFCAEHFGKRFENHDHPAIVWDETVATLAVLLLSPVQPLAWLAGLIAFRFFDIAKPWPISWVDSHVRGGIGVMSDDLAAALPAVAAVHLLTRLY